MKVRQAGRIVSVAVIIAVAVNGDGRREVLGMDIGPSEAETFYLFLHYGNGRSMVNRNGSKHLDIDA